jgi:hypothetical protein
MESVTVGEVSHLVQSKGDLEKILRGDYGAHLPDAKYVTVWFLRDIIAGERLVSDLSSIFTLFSFNSETFDSMIIFTFRPFRETK